MTAQKLLEHVQIFPTGAALMEAAATAITAASAAAMRGSQRFVVALSGGATPRDLYARLARPPYAGQLEWRHVHVCWGDERCVAPDDPASNYRMAREALLDQVPIPALNVHRIRGEDDPVSAAAAYEHELRAMFATPEGAPRSTPGARFDLVLLGMGNDGHTASLFPATTAIRETGPQARWVRAQHVESVSSWRITLTPALLNAAAEVLFLVSGAEKAPALRAVLTGPYQPEKLPAQIIAPQAGRLRWFVDAAAAVNLPQS